VRVVCIIPTRNEDLTISEVVRTANQYVDEVVVIDGHSRDDTVKNALDAGARVLLQDGKGKGMALRTAFAEVQGDIYVVIDGDATYDANEIERMVRPIMNREADIVVGSRLNCKLEDGSMSRINKFGNSLFNLLINVFFGGMIIDSQSGFRALHKNVIENLTLLSKGFEIETEITVKALKFRIREIPIVYRKRRGTPSKLNFLLDGFTILKTIIINVFR
jgi:glycosyltransferase involved in cell wall biosynthesis